MEKNEEVMLKEALKVYGIPPQYVFSSGVYADIGEVVIVTNGGKKIRHRQGEPAKVQLSETDITGELPKQELVWHEKLNQRINLTEILKKRQK
jgi:hypothetical protein